jgi:hypothetical protein
MEIRNHRLDRSPKETPIEWAFRNVMGAKIMKFERKETIFSQGDSPKK